jgi:GT2 family glycosyltransferase
MKFTRKSKIRLKVKMSRKRNKSTKANLDICLLSCGLVEPKIFQECISAVMREAKENFAQVCVYLNGAPKESRGKFAAMIPEGVKIKQTTERVGFPAGANRTIKSGSAPLFLFITDDIVLHPGSLKKLIKRMESDEKIAMIGMKLLFPEDSTDPARPAGRVQHVGHGIDIRGKVTHPLMGWTSDNPKCNVNKEVASVTGGVFLARREAFYQAGGFWEGYGLGYFEDVDLNTTLRENGWKIWIEADAVATHYTNQSMLKADRPVSMQQNEMIFIARKGHSLVNDSWTFW